MNNYSQARKAGVLGISGYSGRELLRILAGHRLAPRGGVTAIEIPRDAASAVGAAVREHGLDIVFLATPHEVSLEAAPAAIEAGARVIDLSGAFRLRSAADFERWYKMPHSAPALLAEAVYGMPEIDGTGIARSEIGKARLVANPGCYPTSVILALAPLLRVQLVDIDAGIVSDSKSGVSGAGYKPSAKTHFCAVQENFSAYGILEHRHAPEMTQALGVPPGDFCFTAHLLPVDRGILSTIYVKLTRAISIPEIHALYPTERFVRMREKAPGLHDVQRTNYCDIHITLSADGRRAVIVSAIDNLVKGAAGQAVQNMNLMLGFPEDQGLSCQ